MFSYTVKNGCFVFKTSILISKNKMPESWILSKIIAFSFCEVVLNSNWKA